jgi:hypothetical protein
MDRRNIRSEFLRRFTPHLPEHFLAREDRYLCRLFHQLHTSRRVEILYDTFIDWYRFIRRLQRERKLLYDLDYTFAELAEEETFIDFLFDELNNYFCREHRDNATES